MTPLILIEMCYNGTGNTSPPPPPPALQAGKISTIWTKILPTATSPSRGTLSCLPKISSAQHTEMDVTILNT